MLRKRNSTNIFSSIYYFLYICICMCFYANPCSYCICQQLLLLFANFFRWFSLSLTFCVCSGIRGLAFFTCLLPLHLIFCCYVVGDSFAEVWGRAQCQHSITMDQLNLSCASMWVVVSTCSVAVLVYCK